MKLNKFRASLTTIFVFALCLPQVFSQQQPFPEPHTQTEESNRLMTPDKALDLLKAGNERFVRGLVMTRPIRQQFRETAPNQFPFAVILSCQDSRTDSQLIFDINNGDAFTIKIAGPVINSDIQGGLEFGIGPKFAKLIIVVGHTDCGAAKGTIDNKEAIDRGVRGNLIDLLRKIRPALDRVDPRIQPPTSSNPAYVNAVAEQSTLLILEEIRRNPIIKARLDAGTLGLVGAMHNLSTGEVTILNGRRRR